MGHELGTHSICGRIDAALSSLSLSVSFPHRYAGGVLTAIRAGRGSGRNQLSPAPAKSPVVVVKIQLSAM